MYQLGISVGYEMMTNFDKAKLVLVVFAGVTVQFGVEVSFHLILFVNHNLWQTSMFQVIA